ncbi:hypothetical protein [Pseudomonas sp. NA-150]
MSYASNIPPSMFDEHFADLDQAQYFRLMPVLRIKAFDHFRRSHKDTAHD